jgi:putative transposase
MIAKPLTQLLSVLDVTRSHSRPHVSDDNPFSESQFKTLKYHPSFPERFEGLADGLQFCRAFFAWYNLEHHHSALCYLTPSDAHFGRAPEILAHRHQILLAAYQSHPERFVRGAPRLQTLPAAVWINPPPNPALTTLSSSPLISTGSSSTVQSGAQA